MSPRIRRLGAADLDAADAILRATFDASRSYRWRIERYLGIQPDGWLIAEDDGAAVGMVGAGRWGAFAYVGLMAVVPAAQRRGVGRALVAELLRELDEAGVRCTVLEATEAGAPLYRQFGFVDHGQSQEWVGGELSAAPPELPVEEVLDLDEVVALDRELYGADRGRMWHELAAEAQSSLRVVRDGGALTGYLCLQPHLLGPWAARDTPAARALLCDAVRRRQSAEPLRAFTSADHPDAAALLEAVGFRRGQRPPHMRRGDASVVPGWRQIFGKESFVLG